MLWRVYNCNLCPELNKLQIMHNIHNVTIAAHYAEAYITAIKIIITLAPWLNTLIVDYSHKSNFDLIFPFQN
jgi:hypothetical protein